MKIWFILVVVIACQSQLSQLNVYICGVSQQNFKTSVDENFQGFLRMTANKKLDHGNSVIPGSDRGFLLNGPQTCIRPIIHYANFSRFRVFRLFYSTYLGYKMMQKPENPFFATTVSTLQ